MKNIAIELIKLYQFFSRFTPQKCRFYPTCSEYTLQAISKFGLLKGVLFGWKRILRCHPFNSGGYDPLNSAKTAKFSQRTQKKNLCGLCEIFAFLAE